MKKTTTQLLSFVALFFAGLNLQAQDTAYVNGTDTTLTIPNGYVATTNTTTVTDTAFSKTDTLISSTTQDNTDFDVTFGYQSYTMYYTVENLNQFSGDFHLDVNNNVDTVITFTSIVTHSDSATLSENDYVYMYITNQGSGFAGVTYDVVNTTVYVEVILDPSSGVDEVQTQTFSVYPNPTSGILNFSFAEQPGSISFNITDMTGKLVKQGTVMNNSLDVSELPKGIYALSLEAEGQKLSSRFTVK